MIAPSSIAIVTHSLRDRIDSISADCLFEFDVFRSTGPTAPRIQIFTSTGREKSPDCRPVSEIVDFIGDGREALTLYHWCDGWPGFDETFAALPGRKVVRWHNNTPPWFFAPYSTETAAQTTRGFTGISRLAEVEDVGFWVNSRFSAEQLERLGAPPERLRVVYPASPLLERPALPLAADEARREAGAIHLLFVGRFVPHKGHRHAVAAASCIARLSGRPVVLEIAGGVNHSMARYVGEVRALAVALGVTLVDHGVVDEATLAGLYRRADVFLGLSEHEGFGLPVLEAMRFGVPVVGLAATAAAEVLARHPLAVERPDPVAVARHAVAALNPQVRACVVDWQRQHVLPRFTGPVIVTQLRAALMDLTQGTGHGAGFAPPVSAGPPLAAVEAALAALPQTLELPPAQARAFRTIPMEQPGRFVTRHDLGSFAQLLAQIDIKGGGGLYRSVWRLDFPRKRRLVSRLLGLLRRAALSLNFGVVASVEREGAQASARLDALSRDVAALQAQTTLVLERLNEQAARPAPAPAIAPDAPPAERLPALHVVPAE